MCSPLRGTAQHLFIILLASEQLPGLHDRIFMSKTPEQVYGIVIRNRRGFFPGYKKNRYL